MKQQALEKRIAELEIEVFELEEVIRKTAPIEDGFWGRFGARLLIKNKKLKDENERYRKGLEVIGNTLTYGYANSIPAVSKLKGIANKALEGEES